ncbi:hypothetical protein V2G26_008652 [Clonostachys chloroleuca]
MRECLATALSSPSDVISCIGPASHKLARHERDRLHLRNMSYLSRIGQSVCTQEAFRQRHLQAPVRQTILCCGYSPGV